MIKDKNLDFLQVFRGSFQGILKWTQLDTLWSVVQANPQAQWYIYAVGETPPTQVASFAQVQHFIQEIDQLLRREHQEDYCGIVYVDNTQAPSLIKIFDPHNLGTSCGAKGGTPMPAWILSKYQPVDLPLAFPVPNKRRHWWQQLFSQHKYN